MSSTDNIIFNIISKAGGGVLLLLSSIIMVRNFAKDDYGSFLQIMLIVNTVTLLGSFGLPESVYFFFQKTKNRKGFVERSLSATVGLAILWAMVLYGLKGLLASWFNNLFIEQYGLVLSLMTFGRVVSQFREPVLISADKLLLNGGFNILGDVLFFLPTIIGPLFIHSIVIILNLVCLGSLITAIVSIIVLIRVIRTTNKPETDIARESTECGDVTILEQVKYSLPIAAASYMGIIGRQIDQYLVSLYFTASDYAVYSRGALRLPVISNLQFFINDLKMPQYVRYFRYETKTLFLELYHKCILTVAKIKYPIFFFLFAMAPIIIDLLYTNSYRGAVPVFRIYSLLLLAEVTIYGLVLRISAKTKFISVSAVITVLSNILVSLLLLPLYGALGAAAGTLISSYLGAIYLLLVSSKISGISVRDIFPWKMLTKILLLSLVVSIPLYFIPPTFSQESAKEGLTSLVLGGTYYVSAWSLLMIKFGLITTEESEVIRRWMRIDLSKWIH